MIDEQNLGEELYNLLAELLNSKMNRTVMDSIRGEYGVLRYLCYIEDHVDDRESSCSTGKDDGYSDESGI